MVPGESGANKNHRGRGVTTPDDDKIRSADDLRRVLKEAGLPEIPVWEIADIEHPTDEEIRRIVEALRAKGQQK